MTAGAPAIDDDLRRDAGATAHVQAMIADARAVWPAWIDEATFVHEVLLRTTGELLAALGRMRAHAADLWLAIACQHGVPAALVAFDRVHGKTLPRIVRKVDDSQAFADEVAQVLRTRLFVGDASRPPRIAEYRGHGSLAGWVRVAATRIALNARRAGTVVLASDDAPLEEAADGDAALGYAREHYREPFSRAVRAAIEVLDARGRTLLRLHYVDGLGIDKIAPLYGVHRSSVARWLADTRATLRTAILTSLRDSVGGDDRECASMAKIVLDQVTLSLGALLRES